MPRSKWIRVIYDRYTKCQGCGTVVHYNVSKGGRTPKYCKACAGTVIRHNNKLRQRRYRRLVRQAVHKS